MRQLSIACIFLALLTPNNYGQTHQDATAKHQQKADHSPDADKSPSAPITSGISEPTATTQQSQTETQADSKWNKAFSPETWSTWAAFVVGIFVLRVYHLTLSAIRDGSERQLRAYVVAESCSIVNVATPMITPGIQPTEASRKYEWGPVAGIHIQNAGQTPASKVRHWGNICFREYPLSSPLPPRNDDSIPSFSILGPGIRSTKTLTLNPRLTDEQVAELRANTAAIYFYGEIAYEDAFNRKHITNYRVFHNACSGPVGLSTDMTFASDGNDAN